jgi:NACHT domain
MPGIEDVLVSSALKTATGPASNALSSWGRRKFDKFIVTYTKVFSDNVQKSISKCETVRNVLYRNQYASTDEKYVSISFKTDEAKDIADEQILSALVHRRKILLRGRGGAGKTMFTKWSVLRLAERFENHQQIPIYVELREIKDVKDASFEQIVFKYVSTSRSRTTFLQFVEGLSIGLFAFILDAADEINKNDRTEICKKIMEFRHTFPECGILLTSRDFSEIEGMRGFERYSTRSLYKKEAISILERLDYDVDVKSALIKEVSIENASRHAFFLENPLMVTIMLLTYDQSKDIPTKRSAFYRRAFEALYERHDASKGIFRRDHHAGLPMDEFERIFSVFCFGTYTNGKLQIPESDLVPLFKEACKISDIDENPADIAKDAHESACLLVKEGHDYVFCHRSFQEYFVAVFLRDYRSDDIQELYDSALSRGQGENVIEFIYEMDRHSFDVNYVIPHLHRIIKDVKNSMRTEDDGLTIARYFIQSIQFTGENKFAGWKINHRDEVTFLFNVVSIYPEISLVNVFLDLEKSPIRYRGFPLEMAKTTKSFSRKRFPDSRDIATLRLSPTAAVWFEESDFHSGILTLWRQLIALHDRLSSQYARSTKSGASRFAAFGKA